MSLMDVDSVRHGQVRLRQFALVVNCIATQNELLSTRMPNQNVRSIPLRQTSKVIPLSTAWAIPFPSPVITKNVLDPLHNVSICIVA